MAKPEAELEKAIKTADLEAVKRIIAEGVDVNAELPAKVTALEFALLQENREIVDALLAFGAQPHQIRNDNPLICAPKFRDVELIKELVRRGADIHTADSDGFTPLHAAATVGFFAGLVYLIEQGADPTVRTKHGGTLFECAQRTRRMCEALLPKCGESQEDQAAAKLFQSQLDDIKRMDDYLQATLTPEQLSEIALHPATPPSPFTFWDITDQVELRLEIEPFPFQSQTPSRLIGLLSRPAEMWEGFEHDVFLNVSSGDSGGEWIPLEYIGLAEAGTRFRYEAEIQLPHGEATVGVRFGEGHRYFTGVLDPWTIEVT